MRAEYLELCTIPECVRADFSNLAPSDAWGSSVEKELKLHRIHAYPAKFPAFITSKALEFAKSDGIKVKTLGDVFCGCGTVAFEARRNGIRFWGCDLSPVATLIASAKSSHYQSARLERYYDSIVDNWRFASTRTNFKRITSERLKYWYPEHTFRSLARLRNAICNVTPPHTQYRTFFLCAFSNILKPTSRWLTKSIKPQLDPKKKPLGVLTAFHNQVDLMIHAVRETKLSNKRPVEIMTSSVFDVQRPRFNIDMIVTSPPYVTSYEYADLHQLSSLWLGYASDYRELREGSIGSTQHELDFNRETKLLNSVGSRVVFGLFDRDRAIAKSVAKYFLDMQVVSQKCFELLRDSGLALFVIGNTEYSGIRVENAAHLAESLLRSGFSRVRVAKRRMSGKILTPYRDSLGRFSGRRTGKHIYGEEFVLIASK